VGACSDIEHLRSQPDLFGSVASGSTLYGTFRQIGPATLSGLWEAMGEVRSQVSRRSATTGTATVVLDIDSSLHQVHSENKDETAANYKGRLRLASDLLLRRRHGRDAGGAAGARQRRGEQHRRSCRGAGSGDRPAAR
jgi:hypothetical protein